MPFPSRLQAESSLRSQPLNDLFQHRARTAAGERRFRVAGERACARGRSGVQSARRKKLTSCGWGISEAGAKPARPRHCERPERDSVCPLRSATGGFPGKASEAASSQETCPPRAHTAPFVGKGRGLLFGVAHEPRPSLLGALDGVVVCARLARDERPSSRWSFSPTSRARAKRDRFAQMGEALRDVSTRAWKSADRPRASSRYSLRSPRSSSPSAPATDSWRARITTRTQPSPGCRPWAAGSIPASNG